MRPIRPVLRVLTTTLLSLVTGAAAVLGASPALASASVDYVALGDSYSSGLGTRDYDSGSGDCLRGPKAYPALWSASRAPTTFRFAACAGATTDDVKANQLGALSSGTDLVSVSVGGNDAGFGDRVTTCQLGTDEACDQAVDEAEAYARSTLPARLDSTYQAIRRGAPKAKVFVLGYPRLFELGSCPVFGALSEPKRVRLNEAADLLAQVISARAKAAGFTFVDVRQRFAGHGVCSRTPWVNGLSWPINESYHPNVDGHAKGYLPVLDKAISSVTTTAR
ncbi:GDSL-like Lipase/Acylhydrolase family protein [Streptoalloteichus tenebrarius]|uniref:GDSL-like Lipase/Acylhydrolase family protein n=1 Tax=Streptoalloteichus tenebrarius (strain ATCC 17920 / DSM 40477 / JCM 4838 / CBS 697.72 / NBRC 16177 / NCIMB 11028 / NRRL B-12390 / A12253. 1 / ISP 5477) TaxID=1933 RepID=A0ABT1HS45_STRSD|nr:SGNH/GDSL hydrolase family protein [Streptoalloteichus tenebrarius]MCP2258341.1 GDSL-like Lipase/Acylhydrolase family protein [Streptoalloteichus tenebrarius]